MSGLGAFMETVNVYKDLNVTEKLWHTGKQLKDGINSISLELGIQDNICTEGAACSFNIVTKDSDNNVSSEFRTLFCQEMARQNIIMNCVSLCYEHGEREIEMTLEAFRKTLKVYRDALNSNVSRFIEGAIIKPVFRKYN